MKTFVITGASDGIGAEIARQLAARHKQDAALVLAARNEALLEAVATQCRGLGAQALAVRTDVSDAAQCRALIDTAAVRFGGITALIGLAASWPLNGGAITSKKISATLKMTFPSGRRHRPTSACAICR